MPDEEGQGKEPRNSGRFKVRLHYPLCPLSLFATAQSLCKSTNCAKVFHDNPVLKGSTHECNKRASINALRVSLLLVLLDDCKFF